MNITFLGHACFEIQCEGITLLTDPFLTGNPMAAKKADEVNPDYILVSHAHGDHVGDTVAIAERTHATIITTIELVEQIFAPKNISCIPGNLGGTVCMPFGTVKFFQALHSCGLPGGIACGFVIKTEGKTVYFAGDTALMTDMSLLKPQNIDVALLPIGDVFTMGPSEALDAIAMICPKTIIPMHYNTMPPIRQDATDFAAQVQAQGISKPLALSPGERAEF